MKMCKILIRKLLKKKLYLRVESRGELHHKKPFLEKVLSGRSKCIFLGEKTFLLFGLWDFYLSKIIGMGI